MQLPGPTQHAQRAFRQRRVRVHARSDQDPYKVLGVKRHCSKNEVREAYLRQIRRYHPDVSPQEDAEEVATRLNIAYRQILQASIPLPCRSGSAASSWKWTQAHVLLTGGQED